MPTGRSLRLWPAGAARQARGRRQLGDAAQQSWRAAASAAAAPRAPSEYSLACRRSAAASRGWSDGRCAGCPAAPRSARRCGSRRFWSSWPSSRTALRVSLPGSCHCRYGLHGSECVAQHGLSAILPRREDARAASAASRFASSALCERTATCTCGLSVRAVSIMRRTPAHRARRSAAARPGRCAPGSAPPARRRRRSPPADLRTQFLDALAVGVDHHAGRAGAARARCAADAAVAHLIHWRAR